MNFKKLISSNFSIFFISLSLLGTHSSNASLKLLWESVQNVDAPESAYFDNNSQTIFVSNVGGNPTDKDGSGWINRLNPDGGVIAAPWISGFNAPKGLRAYKGALWVTDIQDVIQIDITTAKILKRFTIPKAQFLNDIAVDTSGNVYISDTFGSTLYKIPAKATKDSEVEEWITGKELDDPNGLLMEGSKLYVATWGIAKPDFSTEIPGRLIQIDVKTKKIKTITKKPFGNLDGLELFKGRDFLVSDWMAGKVYRITPSGKATLLLEGIKGAADIGYIAKTKVLIVPKMGENKVAAYQLK